MLQRLIPEPPVPELLRRGWDTSGLLHPSEPCPFEFLNLSGKTPGVLICDHASRYVPRALAGLGLDPAELGRHIAWDIGIAEVTRQLAPRLGTPAVLSGFSRLVIDPNRHLLSEGSIPEASDGTQIPGNRGLAPNHRRRRQASLFMPYHAAVVRMIEAQIARGVRPALVFMHSFTPVMDGYERPWHAGILWDRDRRLAAPLIDRLAARGLAVGDNLPYSGRSLEDYSLHAHGEARGLPCVLIEIRQDLIDTSQGAAEWARHLYETLAPLLDDPTTFAPVATE